MDNIMDSSNWYYWQQLNNLVQENYHKNKWIQAQDADFYFAWLQDEIVEVAVELKNWTPELIEFELVDIFWAMLNLIERLHQDGKIDKSWLYKKAYKKYAERLPNIAAWEDIVSQEEQDKLWNEAKKRQKKELGLA